jgi:presenilin-like A22 family membrane protease
MKHKLSITLILLGMFLLTQFIGLWVVAAYMPITESTINQETGEIELIVQERNLPFGLQTPDEEITTNFISIVFSFIFALAIILILMKYKWKLIIRTWFFIVISLALGISIYSFIRTSSANPQTMALAIAVPLSYFKIFKPNVLTHNFTELLIYPGIAAVFIPILTPLSIIGLLILISFYDMWAVWKSGIMQKMAKFQMEELRIFGGFLIPSASAKVKRQIKNLKQKYKGKKMPKRFKTKKFKVTIAMLGGGDVIFPIITAGVFMKSFGIIPAIFIIAGALGGLTFLFAITKKGKAYPAMPYISSGIFLGIAIWKFLIV